MNSKKLILLIFIFTIPLFSQKDIRVISSNANSIVLEYTPTYNKITEQLINNQKYLNISFAFGLEDRTNNFGNPSIQIRQLNLGVPSEYGNTIQVLNTAYKEIVGKVIPVPIEEGKEEAAANKFEIGNDYYNYHPKEDLAAFGEFGIIRGVQVQSIHLLPVKFYPEQNKIKLYTKIVVQINYSSNRKNLFSTKDNFLDGALINFNIAKNWGVRSSKSLKKAVVNSVLSTGKWYRFEAPEEGIYKISRSELSDYGIEASTVDPRTIKIYNNGGQMLPEKVSAERPSDLVENAIMVVGEEDGKFDEGDYIIFYGRGTSFWDYDKNSKTIKREFNLYTNQNYYWITSGGNTGKRIQNEASLNDVNSYVQNTTKAFVSWEKDEINLAKTGRVFLGDDFPETNPTRTYVNTLYGLIPNSKINYNIQFVSASPSTATLKVYENSGLLFSNPISGYPTEGSNKDHIYGNALQRSAVHVGSLPNNQSALRFDYEGNSSSAIGYLDYFEIQYQKSLIPTNNQLIFYSKDTTANIEYHITNFPSLNIKVFDISDYSNVKMITNPILLSGGEFRFQKSENEGNVSEFLALGDDNFKSPSNPAQVNNQNVHGIAEGAKFIIITHPEFRAQADRLQNYRQNESSYKLSTIVVDVKEIENEFANGSNDPSGIRDFIKYAYDNWTIQPEYVLLFGDATYDYKNIEGVGNNFVPVWETYEFLNDIISYPMDDYYARVQGDDSFVDLAVSRITCQSKADAQISVDKIIKYEQDKDFGTWRNLITLVADDGLTSSGNDGAQHTSQSEDLGRLYIPGSYNLDKIYLSAYPTVLTSFGRTKPEVNKAIIKAVNDGTLILNFIGHGSPEVWTHERVFEEATSIPQMVNDKYFFLTAATCDFAYYDLPNTQSSTEILMLKENSGAIAAFASARPVYSGPNSTLNNLFFSNLLMNNTDSSGLAPTIGKAYFLTKSRRSDSNDFKFHLFGDPTLRLNVPHYTASIDSINGESVGLTNNHSVQNDAKSTLALSGNLAAAPSNINNALAGNVQLKALSHATISGSIRKFVDNSVWTDYSGEGILTVFDSQRSVHFSDINYDVTLQGGVIFRGRVSVVNGKFNANFIVPKDISYENKQGKIAFYFFDGNSDGIGYTNNVIVGGTDNSVANDEKGPDIEIYFDNESSIGGTLANPNSDLIIKLSDETGLNTTGTGIGHGFEGVLNDKENDPIDFSNYFTGDIDAGGKSGKVNYKFANIDPGDYKLKVKAWDVFNNLSTETTYFNVVSSDELAIRDVYNYPNPFASNTTFTFQKNLTNAVDLQIKVYTIAGRLIRNIEKFNVEGNFVKINWDGRDEDGNQIANGTYLYKLIVKTVDGSFNKSVLGKLAVIK